MTAVAYAMSDVISVRVPEDRGGCGNQHKVTEDDDGHKVVKCDQCVPYLTGSHASFAGTAEGVPSTPDEIAHRQYLKEQAQTVNDALDLEIRRSFVRDRQERASKADPGDFVSGLSPKEKRELAAMLAKDLGDDEPAKRSPGRPRKTAASE